MLSTSTRAFFLSRNGCWQGHGIFAKQPIYKGEMVVEYTGERVRPVVADVREEQVRSKLMGSV
jgi:hypothetical protein